MLTRISQILPILFLCLICTFSQTSPQFSITNPVLGTTTTYKMSYYSSANAITTSTAFTVYFNSSYLKIPDGSNSCTIKINSTAVSSPICTCFSKVCIFKPNTTSTAQVIQIQIGNITNPFFIYPQTISVYVYYSSSVTYTYSVTIPISNYQPMPMTLNSLTQSDYGVGYTPVTYIFNISLLYIAKNMRMQVTIPTDVAYSTITTNLTINNVYQNVTPLQVSTLLVFQLTIDVNSSPTGYMILILSGLGNPRYLGNSTSFKISFVQTVYVTNCATCKIAQLSSGMLAMSKVPGDVVAVSIYADNSYISSQAVLTINLLLYAGIPSGGKVSIYLPLEITPVLPVVCENVYGFTLSDSSAVCTYNSTANRIDTSNFATPSFDSTGNGILSLSVINPSDSRSVSFTFQTYDALARIIGQSRTVAYYKATPLVLAGVLAKSSQQVDTYYNLSVVLTLGKYLNSSTNYIQVIVPYLNYTVSNTNTSSIKCYNNINTSSLTQINCTKTYDNSSSLSLLLSPPCTNCTLNTTIKLLITTLKNPSYINTANQLITVNTRSLYGIIQTVSKTITITPSTLVVSSYTKPSAQSVGYQYNLSMTVNIPEYARLYGGKIQLVFTDLSTYADGVVNTSNVYTSPLYSLNVYSNNNISAVLNNTVTYNTDNTPYSINKISFYVCDGILSICTSNLTVYTFVIRALKLGYIPALATIDTIRVTTTLGQIIAEKIIDTSAYSPLIINTNTNNTVLSINATNSITNTYTDFVISYPSIQVAIDGNFTLAIPLTINNNSICTAIATIINTYNITYNTYTALSCTKLSNNILSVSVQNIDANLMVSQSIIYTITVTNVSTPTSTAPITISLSTSYNQTINQISYTTFSAAQPYPLSISYSKTNYTIYQPFRLSLTIAPIYTLYDTFVIVLPKNTVIVNTTLIPSTYTYSQNTTHYILSKTGTLTNNYTQLLLYNSLDTSITPVYYIYTKLNNYLVQYISVVVGNNQPVLLGCALTMSTRVVSLQAQIVIVCDRNSQGELGDRGIVVGLPSNGFDYARAVYSYAYANSTNTTNNTTNNNNSTNTANITLNSTTPTVTIPLSTSTPRVVILSISNVYNLKYIPILSQSTNYSSNSISPISISTLTNTSVIVGKSNIPASVFIPTSTYPFYNITASRTITKSGQYTNVSLSYTTLLGTLSHILHITLPYLQNTYINTLSNCFIDNTLCTLLMSNTTDIRIYMKPNLTVTLTKLLNYYPNANALRLRTYTYPQLQLVQQSNVSIVPVITLEKLVVGGKSTNAQVGAVNVLTIYITPTTLYIDYSNSISISIDGKMFTRAFNTDDCIINTTSVSSMYGLCTYGYDSDGWLTSITIGTFGTTNIQINSTLVLTVGVTNSWTAYPFAHKYITATVYKNAASPLSEGTLSIYQLFNNNNNSTNISAFTLLPISCTLAQSNIMAGQHSTLTLTITVNGNVGKSSQVWILLPRNLYAQLNQTSQLLIQSSSSSYYQVYLNLSCTNTTGCINYTQTITIPITNNYYVTKSPSNISLSLMYDSLPCSQSVTIVPSTHTPMYVPGLNMDRNTSVGGKAVSVYVCFQVYSYHGYNVEEIGHGVVTVSFSNNLTYNNNNNTNTNNSIDLVYVVNSTTSLTTSLNTTPTISTSTITYILTQSSTTYKYKYYLIVTGTNIMQIPLSTQTYSIYIQNNTHILYSTNTATFLNKLVPLSDGLLLVRNTTTVGMETSVYLVGTLPQLFTSTSNNTYILYVNGTAYSSINISSFASSSTSYSSYLFEYTNPTSTSTQPSSTLTICSPTSCIYSSTPTLTPTLSPITPSTVSITMQQTMSISTIYTMSINITNSIQNKSYISVGLGLGIWDSVISVTGYLYNTTSMNYTTPQIIYTVTLINNNTHYLYITPVTANRLSLTSLQIKYKTPPYQLILLSSPISITYQLPTTTYTSTHNISIFGLSLTSSVYTSSYKINTLSNYTVNVSSIARMGILSIQIPEYISSLFIGSNVSSVLDDSILDNIKVENVNTSSYVALTGINTQSITSVSSVSVYALAYNFTSLCYTINILTSTTSIYSYTVALTNIMNPPDNRPVVFNLYQHQIESELLSVYGYATFDMAMTVLDSITVYSGIRNCTKMGASIQLILYIQTYQTYGNVTINSSAASVNYSKYAPMLIKLSPTQVSVSQSTSCTLCIDSVCNQSITITTSSQYNTILLSSHLPGTHNYTLSGCLSNSLFSLSPGEGDQIYISLSEPYQTAQSTQNTSTYITPLISTGSIVVSNISSSSSLKASYSNLMFTIQPQNYDGVTGMLVSFGELAYILHSGIVVKVNGVLVGIKVVNSSCVFVSLDAVVEEKMVIYLGNVINYIQNSGFTIQTLKLKTTTTSTVSSASKLSSSPTVSYIPSLYGTTDLVTLSSSITTFSTNPTSSRIILPNNHISSSASQIIVINDYDLPEQMPTSSLTYTIGNSALNCLHTNIAYNKSITTSCVLSQSGTFSFIVTLYSNLSSLPLTTFSKSIYIYPATKTVCDNVLCDSCSETSSGQEYCFQCREGLYSQNGQCVEECSSGTFPYLQTTCEECSPDCAQCYDLYDTSCLSCADSTLLLDSGSCVTTCSSGQYAYMAEYCVNADQCTLSTGCRLCSSTGFCYQCLPDYSGQPTCTYTQILPSTFFVYWMIPLILLLPIAIGVTVYKVGTETLSHLIIYILGIIQFFSWVFVIPKLPAQALSMVLCAFVILKILLSIVAYETYYRRVIAKGKQIKLIQNREEAAETRSKTDQVKQQNQEETISHKERLVRFTAHFISCDAYQLLMSKLGLPYLTITHYLPFLGLTIANRVIVMVFFIYVMANASHGDLIFLPLISIISGVASIFARAINSQKISKCLSKIRG